MDASPKDKPERVAIVPAREREQINEQNTLFSNSQSPPPQTPIILGELQCSALVYSFRCCHSITPPSSPSRTQKFVEPIIEGSCYWPLPLRRVENGLSCFQLNLSPHASPRREAGVSLLLSNFSNCPLASLGNRQQFIRCCKMNQDKLR